MGKILPLFNSEEQLVAALLQADPRAQRKVYDQYAGRMMGVCMRYVNNRMTAEDILVEGFMKVFNKIQQFKSEGSLEGWIRRIMVNESLGYLRQQKRLPEVGNLEDAYQITDFSIADQHLEAEELVKMMDALPTGYRTVFNLFAIEGYSHSEIGEMLGISENTSKSQLHRARATLQQQVKIRENEFQKKSSHEL